MPNSASLVFDGTDDRATVADTAALDLTGDQTVECWFKTGAGVANWNFDARTLYAKGQTWTNSSNTPLGLRLAYDEVVAEWMNGFSVYATVTNVSGLSLATWHHVAATYTSSTKVVRIYVNGTLAVTGSAKAAGPAANAYPASVGAAWDTNNSLYRDFWNGLIDEVRVWSVVRSGTEISDYKDVQAAGDETGLVACWRANEGSGTTVEDFAGAADLTLTGATWSTSDYPTLADAFGGVSPSGIASAESVPAPVLTGGMAPPTPPTVVGAGTAAWTATNAATFTPTLPTGWAADDIHVLVANRSDNTAMTALSGWTQLAALSGNNTTGQRTEVWWRRAVGGDANPVVTFGSGTVVRGGRVYGVRGAKATGDPWDTGTGAPARSSNATSDQTVEFPSLTTVADGCLVLAVGAFDDDFATATTMTGWTQPAGAVAATTLGNDAGQFYQHRTLVGLGAASPATVTLSGGTIANAPSVGLVIALLPAVVPQTVSPSSVGSGEAFGTAVVTEGGAGAQTVTAEGVATAEAVGAAALAPGAVALAPEGVASAEAAGTAVLTPGAATVTAAGVASAEAFGTAALATDTVTLAATGIASAEAVGDPVLTPGAATVVPEGIATGEALGVAVLSAEGGPVTVVATGVATAEATGTPVVVAGAVALAPAGVATQEAVGTPALTTGAVAVGPAGVATAVAVGTPQVGAGVLVLALSGIATQEAVGTAAVSLGGVGNLQRWDGSVWQTAVVRRWDGAAWVVATVRRWTGGSWS